MITKTIVQQILAALGDGFGIRGTTVNLAAENRL
jgi:hypothetical protein